MALKFEIDTSSLDAFKEKMDNLNKQVDALKEDMQNGKPHINHKGELEPRYIYKENNEIWVIF